MINKEIHIGKILKECVVEMNVSEERILHFLKCTREELLSMYHSKDLTTEYLLRWSKLMKYDFFRIYSDHLILYSHPASKTEKIFKSQTKFRKNVYTPELIEFILNLINSKQKTIPEIIERYNIPKTTLYNWNRKYKLNNE